MTPDAAYPGRRPAYSPAAGRRARLARRRASQGVRRRLAVAGLAADAVLVGLFGAGFAARYVPPTSAWSLQAAALALPPLSAAVVASAAGWLVWAARSRTRLAWAGAALHVGLAVLAAARYGPGLGAEGGGDAAEKRAGALRVLSLNAGQPPPGAVRLAAEVAQFDRPDVVALQEASVKAVGEGDDVYLAGAGVPLSFLQEGYALAGASSDDRLTVLVRQGVGADPDVDAPLDPVDEERAGVVNRLEVTWEGRPFALYVVHFRSFQRDGTSWAGRIQDLREDLRAREREARFLRAALDAEELPFLVLGDFNATPDQWSYAHVAAGLQDALADRSLWAPTFPDDRPLVQIDAVLASDHWAVEEARVLPGGLSDHRGVLVDLRWAPASSDGLDGE